MDTRLKDLSAVRLVDLYSNWQARHALASRRETFALLPFLKPSREPVRPFLMD